MRSWGRGEGAVGTAQNSGSSAGEDLDSHLLLGLGRLLITVLINPRHNWVCKTCGPK